MGRLNQLTVFKRLQSTNWFPFQPPEISTIESSCSLMGLKSFCSLSGRRNRPKESSSRRYSSGEATECFASNSICACLRLPSISFAVLPMFLLWERSITGILLALNGRQRRRQDHANKVVFWCHRIGGCLRDTHGKSFAKTSTAAKGWLFSTRRPSESASLAPTQLFPPSLEW